MFRQIKEKIKNANPLKHRGRRGLALLSFIVIFCTFFCIPCSALVADEGFKITNVNFAYTNNIVDNPTVSGMTPTSNNDNQCAFIGLSGNDGITGFYRPLVVRGTSGNSALSYTVTVTYSAYIFNSNDGFRSLQKSIYAAVNDRSVSVQENNTTISDNCTAYGGRFSFTVNANSSFKLVLYSGKNNIYANQLYYNVKFDVFKNDSASAIIDNDDKNTDKQIQADKDLYEQEKSETEDSGNNNQKEAQDAIPKVDGGFLNSLKSLANSLSYDGTEAVLPIPAMYIPAIAGQEQIDLLSAQNYDMSQAISDYIPSNLLQVLRYFLTIALVLFCVYELYGLIQYVLTLKGGKE